MESIIQKIQSGDGLTDDELKAALKFYRELKKSLLLLGRDYHLATVAVIHTLIALESFEFARKNP